MSGLLATIPAAPAQPLVAPGGTLVVPVASPSCPSFGSGGGGVDWNPLDHVPVIGDVKHLVDSVGSMVSTVLGWIHDPGQMVHDVVGWLTWNTIGWNPDAPGCYEPTSAYGFARSVMTGDIHLSGSTLYYAAYSELAALAIVVVFAAGVARIIRAAYEPQTHWGTAFADTVLRIVAGIAAVQLGFTTLDWVLPFCAELGRAIFTAFLSLTVSDVHGFDPLGGMLFTTLHALSPLGLVGLVLVPVLLWHLVKVLILMVMRFVVISFGIAAAPLFIAIAVFDHRASVVKWWWSMMLGAAVAPVVAGGMLGLTLGLGLGVAADQQSISGLTFAPLASSIVMIGGCWLTARALRACLFGLHGQQSGLTLLRHAAETVLFLPAAVASLVTVGALAARGVGAGGVLLQGLGMGRYGSGLVQSAMRSDNAVSRAAGLRFFDTPSAAFTAFKGSGEGERFITDVTRSVMPEGTSAAARWAAVEGLPGIDRALRHVRTSVHAESARTGRLAVGAEPWGAFEEAVARAWTRRPAPPAPDDNRTEGGR